MASLLQKVIRNQRSTRIIASFANTIPPPPFLDHKSETDPLPHSISTLPFAGLPNSYHSVQFYPSFPCGVFLSPISSSGFVHSEAEDISGDSQTIWADSVKKKRKRKMNKHKLKKLRKRLRRKS